MAAGTSGKVVSQKRCGFIHRFTTQEYQSKQVFVKINMLRFRSEGRRTRRPTACSGLAGERRDFLRLKRATRRIDDRGVRRSGVRPKATADATRRPIRKPTLQAGLHRRG